MNREVRRSLRFESLESRQLLSGVPVITEFMAINDSISQDEDGEYTDWIEIHNADSTPLDLAGWHLTDDDGQLDQWEFPSKTLAANEYLVVRASGLNRLGDGAGGEFHTNFKLGGDGEYLALVAPDGITVAQEFVSAGNQYPAQVSDISYGLLPGGTDETYFLSPTPGELNSGPTSDNPLRRVVINEIMHHPDSLTDSEEFIELYNDGAEAIDVSGWQFSAGVDYEFPQGASLAAGDYLVVVADASTFSSKYPAVASSKVFGDWVGRLSNSSEKIELVDQSGDLVDRVTYADQGDWAQRVRGSDDQGHYGWVWKAAHDAGGSSLELINDALSNDQGQNWASSVTAQGTPGQVNSVASSDIAPMIVDVAQSILIPGSGDEVTISAAVRDESAGVIDLSVFYRIDGGSGVFTEVVMADDGLTGDGGSGDRIFGATLPPQADGAIVEFYVRAEDAGGKARTWPAPAVQLDQSFAQTANALYRVDDAFSTSYSPGDQPTFYAIMTEVERAELEDIGEGTQAEAESNAQMNGTVILLDGAGMTARYTTGIRNRGSGSRNEPPNNFRINLPSDQPWDKIDALNINSKYTPGQVFGPVIYQAAGLVSEDSRAVQLRVNGANLASSGSVMFGSYAQVEAIGGDFADSHFPGDGNGNLYKVRDADPEEGDLRYEGTDPDAYRDTYFKSTNEEVDDWSDLIALTDALNNSTDEEFFATVSAVADIDQWFRFFAADTLLLNEEGGLPTGRGDDYTIYRGVLDPRFVLIPHDLDTLMGQGQPTSATSRSLFHYEDVNGMARLFTHPETIPLYYKHLLELTQTVFAPEQFNAYIDQTLGDWVSPEAIQNYKETAAARRAYALSQIPVELTAESSLPTAGAAEVLRSTDSSTVGLSGVAHAALTRSVMVNGVEADWNARDAAWSLDTLPLNPGLNRLIVQAFGEAGELIDTTAVDVWYDTQSMTEVTAITGPSVTWTAEGGPYHLAQDVTVPAGTTLTVEPGTSVFFDEGVELRIEGVLIAAGAQFERIRFSSLPDAAFVPDPSGNGGLADGPPRWAGVHFVDTMAGENTIAYADIEYAQDNASNEGAIGVIRSQAVLDNLSFKGNHLRTIYGESPSWVISNSVFPDVFAENEQADALGLDNVSELIKSIGVTPAGGRFIVEGNLFGSNKGHNDVIDVDSGRLSDGDPIVQILNNIFTAAGDEHLDLGGDVYVAGNLFMNVFKDDETSDLGYANAISTGDAGTLTTTAVVRNIFFDVDHAINLKQGAATLFENNTVVKVHSDFIDGHGNPNIGSAINLYVEEPGATAADGAYASGNLFWDAPRIFGNADLPDGTESRLELAHNFLDPLLSASTVGSRPGTILDLSENEVVGDANFADLATGFALGDGSQARGVGPFGEDFGALVPEGVWIAGQPPAVTDATTADLVVGGPGMMAYRYRVNGGAWSVEIPIGDGYGFEPAESTLRTVVLSLNGLTDGAYAVDVVGQEFGGRWQAETAPTSVSWTVDTVNPLPFDVVINEVLASNTSAVELGGTRPDAIELYNRGAGVVDLGGYSLTDDITRPDRFVFPAGVTLAAGEYLVVYADSEASQAGEIHLGFGLKAEGEGVFLIDWANQVPGGAVTPIDSVEFGAQLTDRSIARLPGAGWGLAMPTLGGANVSQPLGNAGDLLINEWFTLGSYSLNGQEFNDDFIELYNASSLPVSLGGLYLTDDPVAEPDKHQIQQLSFIDAGGYAVFSADGNIDQGPEHVDFKLADDRGWISLFDEDLELLNTVYYTPQASGVSQGRSPDGGVEYAFFAQPTPGLDTSPPTVPAGLVLDASSDTQVDFHWNASVDEQSGVATYEVYRNSDLIGTTLSPSFSDVTVVAGGVYFYQVAAVNGDGIASALSSSIGNTPDVTPPSTPSGLTGTIISSTQIDLSWQPSEDPETGVQFYTIMRNGVEFGSSTEPTFSDTTFDGDSAVTYRITATNNQNVTSGESSPWNVVALQQGVAPSGGYAGTFDTWISENASDVDENFANDVELEVDGEDPLETLGLIRWDLTDVPVGSTVNDVLLTVNASNSSPDTYEIYAANSPWTEEEATWNVASTGVPWQTPGARGAQDRGTEVLGSVLLSDSGSHTLSLNAAGVAVVQQWINDPSVNFGFVISDASNTDGIEFDSSENTNLANRPRLTITYSGADTTPPSAPSGLAANDDGLSHISLTWDPATDQESGISGYRVFRDGLEVGDTTSNSFVDQGRTAGIAHSYQVLAVNGQGLASALSSPAFEYQIDPLPLTVSLSVRDSYLSNAAVLVRVDLRDATGAVASDLWDATATLTTDTPGVTLSADQLTLVNGVGSTLVSIGGATDFTLTATVGGFQDSKLLANLDGVTQTTVAGAQSGVWSGVIHVTGDVTVPIGQTLIVSPGTLVVIDGDLVGETTSTKIVVSGELDVQGTAQDPVTFTASDRDSPWGEIDIAGGVATFDHTVITLAGNADRSGHTNTGPALRVRDGASFDFADGTVSNIYGKIMMATSGDVVFADALLTRAVMGPEISATSLAFSDSWIVDMSSDWHYAAVDDDHDGIYLHSQSPGQQITLNGGVIAMVADDGIDTLGSGVTSTDMIVRNVVDKGYSINGGWIDIDRSLIVDAEVGVATKGDSTRSVQTSIDRTTIARVNQGILMRELSSEVVYSVKSTIIHVNPSGTPLVNEVAPSGDDRFHVNYSLFNEAWNFTGSGVGNIRTATPGFVDLPGNNFHLQSDSLAVDHGDPTSPLDPDETRADMGARPTMQGLLGDYDRNGVVQQADYALWRSTYGASVTAGDGADGNQNGVVDAADYTIWRDNLGAIAIRSPSGSTEDAPSDSIQPSSYQLSASAVEAAAEPEADGRTSVVSGADAIVPWLDSLTDVQPSTLASPTQVAAVQPAMLSGSDDLLLLISESVPPIGEDSPTDFAPVDDAFAEYETESEPAEPFAERVDAWQA